MGRKHCGKRRNCLLRAISPFTQCFLKNFTADTKKQGLVWERVNAAIDNIQSNLCYRPSVLRDNLL